MQKTYDVRGGTLRSGIHLPGASLGAVQHPYMRRGRRLLRDGSGTILTTAIHHYDLRKILAT